MDKVEKTEVVDRLSDEIYAIAEEIWLLLKKLDLLVGDVKKSIRGDGFSLRSWQEKEITQQLERLRSFYERQLRNGEIGRGFWYEVDEALEKELRRRRWSGI
jgi:hypothetical protein